MKFITIIYYMQKIFQTATFLQSWFFRRNFWDEELILLYALLFRRVCISWLLYLAFVIIVLSNFFEIFIQFTEVNCSHAAFKV